MEIAGKRSDRMTHVELDDRLQEEDRAGNDRYFLSQSIFEGIYYNGQTKKNLPVDEPGFCQGQFLRGYKMPEKLREKIKRNEAILADPNASLEEKRNATVDTAIARRFIAKGIEELPDEETAGT